MYESGQMTLLSLVSILGELGIWHYQSDAQLGKI